MPATATKERPILFSGPMVRAILDGSKTQTRRVVKFDSRDDPSHFAHCENGLWQPACVDESKGFDFPVGPAIHCPYGQTGDRLWVRETWGKFDDDHYHEVGRAKDWMIEDAVRVNGVWHPVRNGCYYKADCVTAESNEARLDYGYKYKPSIHMPRWASRITLEVTGVRVERLQEITPDDAIAEGITRWAINEGDRRQFDECGKRRDVPTGPNPLDGRERGVPYLVNAFADLWNKINADLGYPWNQNPWVWAVTFKRIEG